MEKEHKLGSQRVKLGCSFFCGITDRVKFDIKQASDTSLIKAEILVDAIKRKIKDIDEEIINLKNNPTEEDKNSQDEFIKKIKKIEKIKQSFEKEIEIIRELIPQLVQKLGNISKVILEDSFIPQKEDDNVELTKSKNYWAEEKDTNSNSTTDKIKVVRDSTVFRHFTAKVNSKYRNEIKVNCRNEMQTLFTDGFINSFAPSSDVTNEFPYNEIAYYRINIQEEIPVYVDYTSFNFRNAFIDYIDLLLRPDGTIIFIIKTENAERCLDDVADESFRIKMVNWYTSGNAFGRTPLPYLCLFNPVLEPGKITGLYESSDGDSAKDIFHKMFIGNKFYMYTVNQLRDPLPSGDGSENYFDYILYGLGKLIDVDTMLNPNDGFYPNLEFYHRTMKDNTLQIYDNWKALALNETFTVLCRHDVGIGVIEEMVTSRMKLFVSAVYQKAFIFNTNMKYQKSDDTEELEEKIMQFDRYFNIVLPSYNEVPMMFYTKMREAMEVNKVYDILREKVKRNAQAKSQKRESAFNNALGAIAILAIFSALIDYISFLKFIKKADGLFGEWEWTWWSIIIWLLLFIVIAWIFFRCLKNTSLYKGFWNVIVATIFDFINKGKDIICYIKNFFSEKKYANLSNSLKSFINSQNTQNK